MPNAVLMERPSEWTSAREVQQQFMRHSRLALDNVGHGACCRQMHLLGGDFYDFVPLADDRVAILLGDASGKGLAAALMASNVHSSLRTASFFAENDGAATLNAVNRQAYESSLPNRYATLFYALFDTHTNTLRYVNAGHHTPMIIRRDNSILLLETAGAPVGMFPDWKYEEGSVELDPGDLMLAHTDGVTEATNPDGEEWGIEGLLKAALECDARSPEGIVRAVFTAMDEFTLGLQTDDATVIAFQVTSSSLRPNA